MKKITLIIFLSLFAYNLNSQCINSTENSSVISLNDGFVQTLASNVETFEYITVTNLTIGDNYLFTSSRSGNNDFITITNTSNVVIANGVSPLQINNISINSIRIHIRVDVTCITDLFFHNITLIDLTVEPTTCQKPTVSGATTLTYRSDTRMDITWYAPEFSTPEGYEWMFVPQGGGSSFSGSTVAPNTNISTGDVLTPNTTYNISIRSTCGINGDSDYTTFSITTNANPPPSNDLCADAITLIQQTSIPDAISAASTGGTLLGGAGTNIDAESCGGSPGNARDDVWYKFVAKTTSGHITVEPSPSFDAVITLYSGNCNSLSYLACSDVNNNGNEEINYTGLTIGQTYYTRTYFYGSTTPATPTFNIKIWSTTPATDADNDGYVDSVDCNDNDPMINPETVWYLDADGDNYAVSTITQCTSPGAGYTIAVLPITDCNDDDSSINPETVWYLDADGDNYAVSTLIQCTSPGVGYTIAVLPITDCNDNDSSINPETVWYLDADGDNYAISTLIQCISPGAGYTISTLPLTDCDDTDNSIHPGATEIWYDGVDQNCDGQSDYDQDGDGYDSESFGGNDCDDTSFAVNPGQIEIEGNGLDDDCNPSTTDNPLGVEEFNLENVKIYPNPFNQSINIHLPSNNVYEYFEIGLYDINGRQIFQTNKSSSNNLITIDHLSVLQQGIYFVKITSKERNKNVVRELIKY